MALHTECKGAWPTQMHLTPAQIAGSSPKDCRVLPTGLRWVSMEALLCHSMGKERGQQQQWKCKHRPRPKEDGALRERTGERD